MDLMSRESLKNKIPKVVDRKISKFKRAKIKMKMEKKRKFPGNSDCNEKFKKKKKDEKLIEEDKVILENNLVDVKINEEMSKLPTSAMETTPDSTPEKLDSLSSPAAEIIELDVETNEIGTIGEKYKMVSSRRIKAITNACRDTMDILMTLGTVTLHSMNSALKILRDHNILGNKHISLDTLIDLIGLALETTELSNKVVTEKETSFSKIVSNLAISKTPKTSRTKPIMFNSSNGAKDKSMLMDDTFASILTSEEGNDRNDSGSLKIFPDKNGEDFEIPVVITLDDEPEGNVSEKPGKNCITNYFKKLKKSVEERDKNERFSSFPIKTDMSVASRPGKQLTANRRQILEKEMENQTCEMNYLIEKTPKHSRKSFECKKTIENPVENSSFASDDKNSAADSRPPEVEKPEKDVRKRIALVTVRPNLEKTRRGGIDKMRAKLLQFHDNRRPPYWGTWRRKSIAVGARKPFGKDSAFNYQIDSDDEWEEEEEERGESLHGSDDEKEPEEDYEVDNDFFVPHGYLSDDENPDKENVPLKEQLNFLEEQFSCERNQKSRKMTPIVFGARWVNSSSSPEGNTFQDLNLSRLDYFPWTSFPINFDEINDENVENSNPVEEPRVRGKKKSRIAFPDKEVPQLIRIIHGSPQNSDQLARKFLNYWQTENGQEGKRVSLTKKCVLKKINELAERQVSREKKKMCWLVPREKQKEFGVEMESGEKKPQKCYIWKFVKKGDRTMGLSTQVPRQEPDVIIL